jgi:diguanylate cyclase (GGDEF)-like protein/PAS domain S-box-containing protein
MPVTRTEPSADPPLRFDAAGAESGYGAVLSATGQPVVVSDLAGRIVLWSRGAETAYGWSAADTLGRPLSDLLSPAVVQQYRQAAVTPAQDTWVGEAVLRRRDGTPVPVLVTSSPMLDQHGRAVGRVAVPVDLRAQQRAEQTAQELSAIVTSTADAVFTEDLDGTIRTWNRGAEDLYGYAAADVVGRHVGLLASDGAATETQSVLRAVAAGETVRALETVRRRRDGSRVDISLTASPIYDAAARVVGASIIGHDITDRRRLERELARLATHDALTGLPNRVLLVDRLSQALARSVRHSRPLAVLFVDLDRFRLVNADLGYVVGDAVLAEVAERLRDTVAPGDTVARFAGDAFVIVCEETAPAEAEDLAGELLAALARPTAVAEVTQRIAASIGIAGAAGPRPPAPDLLIRNAQAAMYTAKAESGGGSRTFDSAMRTRWTERVAVGADLRQVLADDALEIHFQPIVELASGSLVAVEALLRWPHPERGWIPPALFVPLAEEIGLIAELDDWAFGRACRDIGRMRADGTLPWDVQLAVNVSARDVGPDLVARVLRPRRRAGCP